jgi:hypothetical protein
VFVEQTLVNTKEGMKELSKVTTNDYVLTAQQTYEKVSEIKKMASHGVYRIQTQGNPELYADGETLFRVRTKLKNGKDGREFSNEKWVKAKNLTKYDYILISKNRKIATEYDSQYGWLYAKFFVNPNCKVTKDNTVILYVAKEHQAKLKKISKKISHSIKELKHSLRVEVFDNKFYKLCKDSNNQIDPVFMQAGDAILLSFLYSLVEDSDKDKESYHSVRSKNKAFIYQIGQMISNVNAIGGYSLYLSGTEKVSYTIKFYIDIKDGSHFTCIKNKLYQPVREITEISSHRGTLIGLVVSSYATHNFITKGE